MLIAGYIAGIFVTAFGLYYFNQHQKDKDTVIYCLSLLWPICWFLLFPIVVAEELAKYLKEKSKE